jgi:thioredoxin reductase
LVLFKRFETALFEFGSSIQRIAREMAQVFPPLFNSQNSSRYQNNLPKKIAVIGAGASGLITAQRLKQDGFDVKVFERANHVGGVWKYTDEGVVYRSLTTNIPKEIMCFNHQHPFDDEAGNRSFVPHYRVQRYLEKFTERNNLEELITFSTNVKRVRKERENWVVTLEDRKRERQRDEVFDAVLICCGHFDIPFTPDLKGSEHFRGELAHARHYDDPTVHHGKRVLVVGGSMSANDVAYEISKCATAVHVSDRNYAVEKDPSDFGNVVLRHGLKKCHPNGQIELANGDIESYDVILWCTGYLYDMPFLENEPTVEKLVDPERRRIPNLYQQIFSIEDPTIAFLGVPFSVTPFPCFNWQVRWISAVYSGRASLPSQEHMWSWLRRFEADIPTRPTLERKYHLLGDRQWSYYRFLAMSTAGYAPGSLEYWFDKEVHNIRAPHLIDTNNLHPEDNALCAKEITDDALAFESLALKDKPLTRTGSANVQQVGLEHEPLDFILRYIDMTEGIWDDVTPHRPKYPGDSDVFRKRKYQVDTETLHWRVEDGREDMCDGTFEAVNRLTGLDACTVGNQIRPVSGLNVHRVTDLGFRATSQA